MWSDLSKSRGQDGSVVGWSSDECVELSKKEYELLVRYHDETCSHQR